MWLAYLPQAGVTIGLLGLARQALPTISKAIGDMEFAVVAINLLVLGLTSYASSQVFTTYRDLNNAPVFAAIEIPFLSDLPIILEPTADHDLAVGEHRIRQRGHQVRVDDWRQITRVDQVARRRSAAGRILLTLGIERDGRH